MLSGVINRKRVSGGRQDRDRTSDNVFGGLGSGSSSLNDAILESTCLFARGVSSWSASASVSLSSSSDIVVGVNAAAASSSTGTGEGKHARERRDLARQYRWFGTEGGHGGVRGLTVDVVARTEGVEALDTIRTRTTRPWSPNKTVERALRGETGVGQSQLRLSKVMGQWVCLPFDGITPEGSGRGGRGR